MHYNKMLFIAAISVIVPLWCAYGQEIEGSAPKHPKASLKGGHPSYASLPKPIPQLTVVNASNYEIKLFANVAMGHGLPHLTFFVPSASLSAKEVSHKVAGGAMEGADIPYAFTLNGAVPGVLPHAQQTIKLNAGGLSSWYIWAKIDDKWSKEPVLIVRDKPLAPTVTITSKRSTAGAAGAPIFQFDMH